ncbi:hypothetical protein K440DRAFT_144969 [Wilcoxina mikolae CBS 423.85]|nr:hypothetical protein K440DRAFT_144969 [Wilcoxina mikolae CBS 423.85]
MPSILVLLCLLLLFGAAYGLSPDDIHRGICYIPLGTGEADNNGRQCPSRNGIIRAAVGGE